MAAAPESANWPHRLLAVVLVAVPVSITHPARCLASCACVQGTTLRVPTGIADHYAETPEGSEIIEAKSSSDHLHVRQALSQLLDYSRFSPRPVIRLTAPFPDRPGPESLRLLHDYDIDCIYLQPDGEFIGVPAPGRRRKIWQDTTR
jgi:hypothetical protein